MAFISPHRLKELKNSISNDSTYLKKLFRTKKLNYMLKSVQHSLVDDHLKIGWTIDKENQTTTRLRKIKQHSLQFEDDIWCQLYQLKYNTLNIDAHLNLPFKDDDVSRKQIDVFAFNGETAIIVECKSSEKLKKAPSYKDEFDLLSLRLDGFKKVLNQLFGRDIKIKYFFATRNLRISENSIDLKRLSENNAYYHNDSSYSYVKSLIEIVLVF